MAAAIIDVKCGAREGLMNTKTLPLKLLNSLHRLIAAIGLLVSTGLLMPATLLAVMLSSNADVALAKASLMDPGVLESVENKDGASTQKYSDGLIVEISDHQISEKDEHFSMSAEMPDAYGRKSHDGNVDDFISQLIDLAGMHGGVPNSSREQALLRHFSGYYLKMKEPDKAERLAELYLQSQKVLEVKGEPLAYAERTLGAAKVGVKKYKEAVPLLVSAENFYKTSDDQRAYWQVLKDLSLALSETGQAKEGFDRLEASKALAAKNGFVELGAKLDETPTREQHEGIRPTGAIIRVDTFDSK